MYVCAHILFSHIFKYVRTFIICGLDDVDLRHDISDSGPAEFSANVSTCLSLS
jgi:hypothetical protein